MKILASPHPFLPHDQRLFAPDTIEEIFSDEGMPSDSWHAGFSRTGDFLYHSDNLPLPWTEIPTRGGIDPFFQALESFTYPGDIPRLNEFRTASRIEPKADILLRINRKDLTLPPRIALSSRKEDDILHFAFLPVEGRGSDFDHFGSGNVFVRTRQTLSIIAGWLEQIDEETLGIVGAGVFRQDYREDESDVLIRSLRGGLLLKTTKRPADQLPGLPPDVWATPRWWGSRIGDSFDPQEVWVHTVLHCARGLPVMTNRPTPASSDERESPVSGRRCSGCPPRFLNAPARFPGENGSGTPVNGSTLPDSTSGRRTGSWGCSPRKGLRGAS